MSWEWMKSFSRRDPATLPPIGGLLGREEYHSPQVPGSRSASGSRMNSRHEDLIREIEGAHYPSPGRLDTNDMLQAILCARSATEDSTSGHHHQQLLVVPSQHFRSSDIWTMSALNSLAASKTSQATALNNMQRHCPPFPMKLYSVLSDPENTNIISFLPHGHAWKIHNMLLFQTQILPSCHFESHMYPSSFDGFIRLLKLWGFRQFTAGPDSAAFFHEMFAQELPDLLHMMRPLDPSHQNGLHDPEQDPNFCNRAPLLLTTSPESSASRSCLIVPESAELVALAGLHSLAQGKRLRKASVTSLSPSSTLLLPAKAPESAEAISANLCKVQKLHELSIQHLRDAEQLSAGKRQRPLMPTTFSPTLTSIDPYFSFATLSNQTAKTKHSFATLPLPKAKRRKWLPPLGPAGAAPSSTSDYNWCYTNPEAFASTSESTPS